MTPLTPIIYYSSGAAIGFGIGFVIGTIVAFVFRFDPIFTIKTFTGASCMIGMMFGLLAYKLMRQREQFEMECWGGE